MATSPHQPVLYQPVLDLLEPLDGGRYVDGTLGAGGHAHGILTASGPNGRLLGLDVDGEAIALAKERLDKFGDRANIVQASYTTLDQQLYVIGWDQVDGILLDLGASSMQFDSPERGFSFMQSGPLDMRFDNSLGQSAAELVNNVTEEDLAALLREYGEERKARRIARAITKARPLQTTSELAELVAKSVGRPQERIHPATRTFQALRIAVNTELENVKAVLPQALAALKPGGRMAVISFHSLEDRMVKRFIQQHSRPPAVNPDLPPSSEHWEPNLKEITRKPVTADEEEVQLNPRSRSAKLRVAEKV
ncbi:MAG: 16S rRNA (cytosine(1402)-N(4))-methyltransferase RsmH [Chloroflexi bacterium]|nr:MAG: 16S rRNA (cytosine(1402)-N(4))-methyltransferase RsmH [Chloroflexota bacterium]MBL1196731.1 16S rRNA (cytosine(1402)-N(4))-methyltransferase RsmH [Chloroflexota bacterium]NOH14025.1 16S rRNA (cytosine(1402)-N(4))-methyltransferase RsmH [Chloroflexota bacterium]